MIWEGLGEEKEYTPSHWRILEEKRSKAKRLVEALQPLRAPVVVHGSIARGDVREDSDIDVVLLEPVPPSMVELLLEKAGYRVYYREVVQATPGYVPKVYYYLDEREEKVVSHPLARLRPREREFYKWGGELDYEGLARGKRVPGVSKELRLIIPTPSGHVEMEVEGNEHLVARIVGVSIETVLERVRVLTRRREHGRTGVFLKVEVPPGVSVEETVERLRGENPYFRRMTQGTL